MLTRFRFAAMAAWLLPSGAAAATSAADVTVCGYFNIFGGKHVLFAQPGGARSATILSGKILSSAVDVTKGPAAPAVAITFDGGPNGFSYPSLCFQQNDTGKYTSRNTT